jgi:outer membrane protein assembly factor BamB
MKGSRTEELLPFLPAVLGGGALLALVVWLQHGPDTRLVPRVPGTDRPAGTEASAGGNPVLAGRLVKGDGIPADLPGQWPGFRGPNRDNISTERNLARVWGASGPRQVWTIEVGEGYAGAAVLNGRVYVMDYDSDHKQDALRCLSLADGKEIWRFAYPVRVKRNHGMSRTVPAVTDRFVVAMGPKCHVICLDAASGELRWGLDLVRQYGATVPQWYAGQCPLIENGVAILAPGGPKALLMAIDCETGKVLWQTPNPNGWKMTHSSVMPIEFASHRMYVYCASLGVVGVSAKDGAILWQTTDWKISIANVPSPVPVGDGRIFLSGGYDAGSLMLRLKEASSGLEVEPLYRLDQSVFGAVQQTPILFDRHLYGVRYDGQFVCLDLDGHVLWTSSPSHTFGLGSFLMADGLILALNDGGRMSLIEATPARFNLLAQAQVLKGREAWGPMALAGGRLIARDSTRMVCLDVTSRPLAGVFHSNRRGLTSELW